MLAARRLELFKEAVGQQCHLVVIINIDRATVQGSSSGFCPGPSGPCSQAASGRSPPCPPTCRLRSAPGR